ncbi:hypothetical protein ACT8ZV_17225 [Nocardioides sp. MAHUQ-72]|uniref:hypothetical protein n=1 Tax=unclassified Nocardioides TaxID=2615069 RepID=UPI003622E5A5
MSIRSWGPAVAVTAAALSAQFLVAGPTGAVTTTAAQGRAAPVAAGTWGPVKRLDADTRGESLAVDARGVTTIVWATRNPPREIKALRRTRAGDWGAERIIGHGYAPQVAVDAEGNVTVVWLTQHRDTTDGVLAVRRPVGGPWSEPVRLTQDRSVPGYVPGGDDVNGASDVRLAANPAGAVVVAWAWGSGLLDEPSRVQSAYQAPGQSWTAAEDVTSANGAGAPLVGIDAQGGVVLVYARQRVGHPQVLRARQRPAEGGWTAPTVVADEGYGPSLAVDLAGDAVVVFTRNFNRVRAVRLAAGGQWGPARALSPAGVTINDYALAMNGRGKALVALARGNGRVDLVRRPPQGRWSAPVRVVGRGNTVGDVLVALDEAGDTFVGYGLYALWGKYRPRDGVWGRQATISPDSGVEVLEETFAAMAPDGDVVVLWEQEERPLKVRVMTTS